MKKAPIHINFTNSFLNRYFIIYFEFYFILNVYMGVGWQVGTQRPEDGIRSPGAGVTGDVELPYGCWEVNSGPLGK